MAETQAARISVSRSDATAVVSLEGGPRKGRRQETGDERLVGPWRWRAGAADASRFESDAEFPRRGGIGWSETFSQDRAISMAGCIRRDAGGWSGSAWGGRADQFF